MGANVSRRTPVESNSAPPTTKDQSVGNWFQQDLTNLATLADARELAVLVTQKIDAEPDFDFRFTNPTINVRDFRTQVVNGTNYIIEFSVGDSLHNIFVTANLYRPLQTPISKSQIIHYDWNFENINRGDSTQPTTKLDKTTKLPAATTSKRPRRR